MSAYSLPLAGIRVLDITQFMAGPYCTRMLADQGADVYKIEPPGGEQVRHRAPLRQGRSTYFAQLNAGKKSVVVDLKAADGQAALKAMSRGVDVIVQNYRPGVLDRLGLGYADLVGDNPGLVYCSISGYGPQGARSQLPAYAQIIGADTGFDLAHLRYQRDQSEPAATGIFLADTSAGMVAYGAVVTGLYARQANGGRGSDLHVSIFDTMMSTMTYEMQTAQHGRQHDGLAYRPSRTSDGFISVTPISEPNFRATLKVIGASELETDERFATVLARESNWDELQSIVQEWTSTQTSAAALAAFREAGVPCAVYRTVEDVLADEEVLRSPTFRPVVDDAGSYLISGPLIRRTGESNAEPVSVAELGEHTISALMRLGGHDRHSALDLVRRGVVADAGEPS